MPKISLLAQKLWPAALLTYRQTHTQTEKAKKEGPIRQDERGRLSLSIFWICGPIYIYIYLFIPEIKDLPNIKRPWIISFRQVLPLLVPLQNPKSFFWFKVQPSMIPATWGDEIIAHWQSLYYSVEPCTEPIIPLLVSPHQMGGECMMSVKVGGDQRWAVTPRLH